MARLLLLRVPRADARRRLQMARAQEIIEAKKLAKAEAAKVRRRREPQGLLQLRVRACATSSSPADVGVLPGVVVAAQQARKEKERQRREQGQKMLEAREELQRKQRQAEYDRRKKVRPGGPSRRWPLTHMPPECARTLRRRRKRVVNESSCEPSWRWTRPSASPSWPLNGASASRSLAGALICARPSSRARRPTRGCVGVGASPECLGITTCGRCTTRPCTEAHVGLCDPVASRDQRRGCAQNHPCAAEERNLRTWDGVAATDLPRLGLVAAGHAMARVTLRDTTVRASCGCGVNRSQTPSFATSTWPTQRSKRGWQRSVAA